MPELDTSTLAVLQTSRLFIKCMLPNYSNELNDFVEKYPLLGQVLAKAVEWAPRLLPVIPPEHPNVFTLDLPSDESENDSAEESSAALGQRETNGPASSRRLEAPPASNQTNERLSAADTQSQPQPGPSREPQPGNTQFWITISKVITKIILTHKMPGRHWKLT